MQYQTMNITPVRTMFESLPINDEAQQGES
jgi:hypothetical protein